MSAHDASVAAAPAAPAVLAGSATLAVCCWPLATAADRFNPGFFQLQSRDGHLYGSLIDILNRAAPLMLVALGMTLVIATRGIDISVGAVVAIAGAVAALMIGGELVVTATACRPTSAASRWPRRWPPRSRVAALCGLWNGLLVAHGRHAADRRHADPDGGRPRPGAAAHRRPDHHRLLRAVLLPRQRLPARPAVLAVHRGRGVRRAAC